MGIDIFSIQPTVISRDLKGKSFLIYGDKKVGKTSNAVKFPKPLLVAFEKGYNMLSGVMAQPVNKWTEALTIKKQLLKDADAVASGDKKETTFSTIVIDTADLAYNACEEYILSKEGTSYLSETEDKRGYKEVEKEFDKYFQEICKAGYALIVISHSTTVQIKDKEAGEKYDRIIPTVDKRGLKVLSRLVDIIAYAALETDENDNSERVLYMRGSKFLEAGSRNKYTSEKIPFTYEALRDDMSQAIDKLEAEGANVVDKTENNVFEDQSEQLDYNDTVRQIGKIAKALNEVESFDKYTTIIEKYLGKGKKVKDCDESQVDILGLILSDLNDLVKTLNIEG